MGVYLLAHQKGGSIPFSRNRVPTLRKRLGGIKVPGEKEDAKAVSQRRKLATHRGSSVGRAAD